LQGSQDLVTPPKVPDVKKLKSEWNKFKRLRLPSQCSKKVVDGVSLSGMDMTSREMLEQLIETEGDAGLMTPVLLRNSVREMNDAIPMLSGEAKEYFTRLHDVASLCLKELGLDEA